MRPIIGPFEDNFKDAKALLILSICRNRGVENTAENIVSQIAQERPLLVKAVHDDEGRSALRLLPVPQVMVDNIHVLDHFTVTPSSVNPDKVSVTAVFRVLNSDEEFRFPWYRE